MASHHKMHMKHKHRKSGGRVIYEGEGSNVAREAEEKKSGGRVHHGKVHGSKGKHRIHKKRGGGVSKGSDHHPFSSAYTASTEAE